MAKKVKVQFVDYGNEFENNEKEWDIERNGEQVGTLYKHTGWSGSSWTVTHYSLNFQYLYDDDPEGWSDMWFDDKDFDVKGIWAGMGGYGGSFRNRRGYEDSRKALSAAKRWARRVLGG
jgi:hypothetical protein